MNEKSKSEHYPYAYTLTCQKTVKNATCIKSTLDMNDAQFPYTCLSPRKQPNSTQFPHTHTLTRISVL